MIIDTLTEIPAVPSPSLGLLPAIHDAEIEKISILYSAQVAQNLAAAINKGALATAVALLNEVNVTAVSPGELNITASSSRGGGIVVESVQAGDAGLPQISKTLIAGIVSEADTYEVLIGGDSYSVVAGSFEFPAAGSAKGRVFINDLLEKVILPATEKWPARDLASSEICGSDGRLYYQVTNKQGTTSYYPSHFERNIYTFSFSEKTFPLGDIFDFERFFYFRLIGNNSTAVWSVIFDVGERVYQTTPATSYQMQAVLTSGQKTIQVSGDIGKLLYLMAVSGDGVPDGLDGVTYIESINAASGSVTLTKPVTASGAKAITFTAPVGPNLASWRWLPPLLEQEIVMTDMKSMNNLGVWIKNWGEKTKTFPDGTQIEDPNRNDYGFEGYAKLFSQSYPVKLESLPSSSEFLLRLRIGQFDTENGVADPKGFAAYVIRADEEDKPEADSA